MFSFHKPKVYRSSSGCCICKAKSSSSRFTDSKRYEIDFLECFQLVEPRTGEVCNACVLLVKRWKKLPEGSERHWSHVVDARSGPGSKSLVRKNNARKMAEHKLKKAKMMAEDEEMSEDHPTGTTSAESINEDDEPINEDVEPVTVRTRRKGVPKRLVNTTSPRISDFLDMTIWKRVNTCCGLIFMGPNGVTAVDPRFVKPCALHKATQPPATVAAESTSPKPAESPAPKPYSSNSSDSGYDESSNPINN